RADILAYLRAHWSTPAIPAGSYWDAVTWAELYFGSRDYAEAGRWLAYARQHLPSEWEQQTTFKQLVSLARLQQVGMPREGSARPPGQRSPPFWATTPRPPSRATAARSASRCRAAAFVPRCSISEFSRDSPRRTSCASSRHCPPCRGGASSAHTTISRYSASSS